MTEILGRFDDTLEAWELGPDAARWSGSPEPEEAEREWAAGSGGWRYAGYLDADDVGALGSTRGGEVRVHMHVDIEPFRQAMNRAAEIFADAYAEWQRQWLPVLQWSISDEIQTWLRRPAPSELTNETLRLLAEAPQDAAIATTTVETSCSDEPIPVVVQPPEVTIPESPKVRAAIERWSDEEGKR